MVHLSIHRRQVLSALGTASVGILAGCSENGEQADNDGRTRIDDEANGHGEATGNTDGEGDTDSELTGPSEFVSTAGTNFAVGDDVVFYNGGHSGGNLHSQYHSSSPDFEYTYDDEFDGEHYVADFMRFAAAHGMNVIRMVVSQSSFAEEKMHSAPGEFNDTWFEHFDTVVAEAKRHDIRLIVSLMSHDRELPPSQSGYARWSDEINPDELEYYELNDAFFADEQANDYYKEFIEYLLTRESTITGIEPRNDPTIMMWECGNEIEYWGPENEGGSLAEWYDDIASFIKSFDDQHLITTGMYGSDERGEFVTDHQVDAIDVCSFHLYPLFPNYGDIDRGEPYEEEPWTNMSIDEMTAYIEQRVHEAHEEIGKPVILGEFGTPQLPEIYGWDLETRNKYFEAMYETAAAVDLNGVNVFALELDLKFTGEPHITDGRDDIAIYPVDDGTVSVIERYSETVGEKSENSALLNRHKALEFTV